MASVLGAGSSSSGGDAPAVHIKTEKGVAPETKKGVAAETSPNDKKTFESLKSAPRKVLLQIGNASTELKVMSGKIDKLDKTVLKY
eukprot:7417979-Pyramimonas_sp.AAC.1